MAISAYQKHKSIHPFHILGLGLLFAFVTLLTTSSTKGITAIPMGGSEVILDAAAFAEGAFSSTTAKNGALELKEGSDGQYPSSGTWTSAVYDVGATSMWQWFWAEQNVSNFPNLMTNGSFETDTSPADGIPDGWTEFLPIGFNRVTQHVTSGTYSMKIDPPDFPSGGAYHLKSPAIEASGNPAFHVTSRVSGDIHEAGFSMYLQYVNTASGQVFGSSQLLGSSRHAEAHFQDNELMYYFVEASIPTGANAVQFGFAVSGRGPIWLDDVAVYQASYSFLESRTSDDNATWSNWEVPRPFYDNQIALGSTQARYIQLRITLGTEDPVWTPSLLEAHLTFNRTFPVILSYGDTTRKFFSPTREPTGTHGFVTSAEGHLVFDDGTAARFLSSQDAGGDATDYNLTPGTSCGMMENMGFNMLKMDIGYWKGLGPGVRADFYNLPYRDRFDQIVKACGDKGIYLYLRLYIEQRIVAASVSDPDYTKLSTLGLGNEYYFDEAMQTVIKSYLTDVLTHVNPYTNKKLGVDPTIVIIEYFNEQGIIQAFLANRLHGTCLDPNSRPCRFPKDIGPDHVTKLNEQWNAWLRSRYTDRTALMNAWMGTGSEIGRTGLGALEDPWSGNGTTARILYSYRSIYTTARFRDTVSFYVQAEEDFYTMMKNHINALRASDGVKTLTVGTQTLSALSRAATKAQLINDVVDTHNYIDLEDEYNRKQIISQIQNPSFAGIPFSAKARSLDRPFTMSEHNQTGYTDFTAEMPIFASAYGAFQDIDVITAFALNNTQSQNNSLIFNFDPVRWMQFPVASNLFLRDILRAQTVIGLTFTPKETLDIDTVQAGLIGLGSGGFLSGEYALLHGVGVQQFDYCPNPPTCTGRTADEYRAAYQLPQEPSSPFISDTGQLSLDAQQRILRVNTLGTQGVVGSMSGTTQTLPNLVLELEATPIPTLSVFATALDTANIGTASDVLITAVGKSELTGMKSSIDRRQVTTFGDLPALTTGVAGTITVKLKSSDVTVTAIDANGSASATLPVTVVGDSIRFSIDPSFRSLWYRVLVNPDNTSPAPVNDLQAR